MIRKVLDDSPDARHLDAWYPYYKAVGRGRKSGKVLLYTSGDVEKIRESLGAVLDKDAAGRVVCLDHVWKSVYQLDNAELAAAVGKDIYAFVFNYRADASPEDGYLVASEGKVFLSDGEKISFEYVGIAEKSTLDDSAEEVPVENDELGFSMM